MKPLKRERNPESNNAGYYSEVDTYARQHEMNQENVFEQTYEDLRPKLDKDPNLIFVDNYVFPNGSVYKGQMMVDQNDNGNEMRHGYGIQKWVDNAIYEGQWKNNKACGRGTFWHAEGDVYVGEFKDDQANGFGVYTHVNGSKYTGQWVNDVQDGEGEEVWSDGAVYVGKYKNG